MSVKINQKIVGYQVLDAKPTEEIKPLEMNETVARPEMLVGSTYKVNTPVTEHSMYITINDIVLNEGTDHEIRQPYEIFINSKAMEHLQWVVALTRVISAVFRKGGDVTFLVEEISSVYDPNGGYYKKGGVFMPSLVAEIGTVIEKHMKAIGLIKTEELDENTKKILAEKRAQYEGKEVTEDTSSDFPPDATLCPKCNTKAVIIMDGCQTCLNCADSKCG